MFLTFSEFFNISRFEDEILARFKAAVTTFNCNPKTKTCKLCKKVTGVLIRDVSGDNSKIGGNLPGGGGISQVEIHSGRIFLTP